MRKLSMLIVAAFILVAFSFSSLAGTGATWSGPAQTGKLIYDNVYLTNSVLVGNTTGTFATVTATTADINGGTVDDITSLSGTYTAGSTANAGTAGTGVTAVETGDGNYHKTVLTLTDITMVVADGGFTNVYPPSVLYTFPAGLIKLEGGVSDIISIITTNFNASTDDVYNMSIGTGDATAGDGSLTGAAVTLIPSTEIDTVDATIMTNDFNSVSTTDTYIDGTTTAATLMIFTGIAAASDLGANTNVCNGTVEFAWWNLGDN